MSFFNNPEYNQLKVLLIIALIVIGGFFVYKFAGNPDSSQVGSVFQGTKKTETVTNIGTASLFNKDGSCSVAFCTDITATSNGSCITYPGKTVKVNGVESCNLDETQASAFDSATSSAFSGSTTATNPSIKN